MPVDVTDEYIRIRQRDPGDFQEGSFRTITLSEEEGVKAVIGRLKGETTTTVQSYLFDKDKWTVEEAKVWVKEHKETAHAKTLTVKALGDWELEVLGCPYYGPDNGRDAQGEYFDVRTNFHEDKFSLPPVVYYHGFDPDGRPAGEPVYIGKTTGRERRDDGVWYRVVLDQANEFAGRVWQAAKDGIARASSGAVAHLVRTDTDGHIRHWPVAELSVFDAAGARQPANGYAVALPVMKAVYSAAGMTLPAEADISKPEADATGDRVTVAADAERSEKAKTQGAREMDQNDIKAIVAEALANAEKERIAKSEAEAARKQEIEDAIKAERDKWDQEAAKAGRLPLGEAPAVSRFASKYDHLDPADHALMVSVLDAVKGIGRATEWNPEQRLKSLTSLAAKAEAEEKKGDEPAHEGIKALTRAGFNVKANEIQYSTLPNYGDEWVGVQYSTQLWRKIRTETPVVGKIPAIEVPQGMESIVIPLEAGDPYFYKVAQAASLPTGEATGWPNATITSSQMGTAQRSLTVAKAGARVLWTGEMEEDSLIPFVSQLREQLERAGAEQLEHMVIDGDTDTTASTNINKITGTPTATDGYLLVNGFRKLALVTNTGNSRSAGTLTVEDFLETAKLMGDAGRNASVPGSIAFILDPWTHWKTLELEEVKTKDVFSAPTLENGKLTGIYGYPIIISHNIHAAGVLLGTVTSAGYKFKANTSGKVDQATEANNTTGSILAVRWDQWRFGWKRRMTIETTRIARADTTEIVALLRFGLTYRDTEASAVSYNVAV